MANKKNRTTDAAGPSVEIFPEDDLEIVTLTDEENNEIDFYEIAVVDYENEFFALLQPVEQIEGVEEDEVLIFKIGHEDEENDVLTLVDDDETVDKVFELFLKAEADKETSEEEDGDGCEAEPEEE